MEFVQENGCSIVILYRKPNGARPYAPHRLKVRQRGTQWASLHRGEQPCRRWLTLWRPQKTMVPIQAVDPVQSDTERVPLSFYEQYPYSEVRFRLSPDGQNVALNYISDDRPGLVLRDIGAPGRQVTLTLRSGSQNGFETFDWSPDSSQIAYGTGPYSDSPQLWVAGAHGETPRLLWAGGSKGTCQWVRWSPDGEHIFFVFTPSGTNGTEGSVYYVVRASGGPAEQLFVNGAGLYLSDGGKRITFAREFVDGKLDLSSWIATLTN